MPAGSKCRLPAGWRRELVSCFASPFAENQTNIFVIFKIARLLTRLFFSYNVTMTFANEQAKRLRERDAARFAPRPRPWHRNTPPPKRRTATTMPKEVKQHGHSLV